MVFRLHRLPVERQRNVGRALAVALDRARATPLTERTLQAGREVVAVSNRLQDPPNVPAILVDVSTDVVFTAAHRLLRAWTRAFAGELIALERPQQELLDAARFLTDKWFPNGVEFLRAQMSIQWDSLQPIAASFDEPEVSAAVEKLSMRPLVDHMRKHVDLYGQTVGLGEGKPKPGSARTETRDHWQEAMKDFAIAVLADYGKDPSTRTELLGVYEQQLAEHRAALAAARKKLKAKSGSEK
jgi:hypothetical protein